MRQLVLIAVGLILLSSAAAGRLEATQALTPEVVVTQLPPSEWFPRVVYNSVRDEYLVLWSEWPATAGGIRGRRFDRHGRPLGDAFQVSPSTGFGRFFVNAVHDPGEDKYLIVFMYDFNGDRSDWDIHMMRLTGDGLPLPGEWTIAATAASEESPVVAFSAASNTYLVAWLDLSVGFKAALFGWGEEISPFLVGNTLTSVGWATVDIAWQPWGDNFLVVYSSDSSEDVLGKVIGSDGLIGTEIAIAGWPSKEWNGRVASCANFQYLVTWTSEADVGEGADVYGRFLLGNGAFWGDVIHFASDSHRQEMAAIACLHGGVEYLVTFSWRSVNDDSGFIMAQRVLATGGVGPDFNFGSPPSGTRDARPAVAGGPAGWFTAFERWESIHDPTLGDIDLFGRGVWQLFADGFEWGTTAQWSSAIP